MANLSPFNIVLCDSDITWTFDDSCYITAVSGEKANDLTFEYEDLIITLDKREYYDIPDNEVNLTDCNPSTDFNLSNCITSDYNIVTGNITVSGNNLKHDFNLCNDPESENPDLNIDPYTFIFYPNVINDCVGKFILPVTQTTYVYTPNAITIIGKNYWRLVVERGSYLQTGNDVALFKHNVLSGQGSYLQTGNDVALEENRKILRLTAGSYLQTGNDVALLKESVVSVQGSYLQSGNDVGIFYSLPIVQNSYTQTGNDVILYNTSKIEQGIYLQTGNDATLIKSSVNIIDRGSYVYTGNDVALEENRKIIRLDAGSYVYTGNDATLIKSSFHTVDQGIYLQTGNDVGIFYSLPITQNSYLQTGRDVTFSKTTVIGADQGTYVYTGNDVAFFKDTVLPVNQGIYLQTGNDVSLQTNQKIIRLDPAIFLQTGNDVTFFKGAVLPVNQGTYVYTGNDVGVARKISIDLGTYLQTGNDVALVVNRKIAQGTFLQTGNEVELLKSAYRTIDQGTYLQTGNDVALEANRKIIRLDAGSYLQTGNDVTFIKDVVLPVSQGTYVYTGNDVGVVRKVSIVQTTYNRSNNTAQLYKYNILPIDQNSYVYTGNDTTLLKYNILPIDQNSYVYTGNDVGVGLNLKLMRVRPRAEFTYTGNDVGVFYKLSITQGDYVYTGNDVGIINRLYAEQGSYNQTGIDVALSFNPPALGYTGDYAVLNELGVPFALDGEGYTGEYSILDSLAQTINFRGSAYTGDYSDCDFVNNPPDEFEPIAYTGEYADQGGLATTMNLYPFSNYSGEYSDGDLTVLVADFLDGDAYTGDYADFLDFETNPAEEMEALAYSCEYTVLDFLNTTDQFNPEYNYTGEYADLPAFATTDTFNPEYNYTGEYVDLNDFYVHHGEELSADVYTGEYSDAIPDGIKIYHKFSPQIIISSQTAYDGFAETGGLNFCTTSCCEISDGLNVVFELSESATGIREPWGKCGSDNSTGIDVELRANIRFEADCYTGESNEVFIEKELTTFLPMGDDEYWLYNPTPNPTFDGDLDPVFNSGEYSHAELEDDRQGVVFEFLDVENNTEVEFEADLTYDEADWKYPFKKFEYEFEMDMVWEGKEYIRFCPGYLIPDAQNVVFDFAGNINIGCFGYFVQTGESVERIILETISGLGVPNYSGEYANALLSTYIPEPWLLFARTGEYTNASLNILNALYPNDVQTGEYSWSKMPDRIWEGYTGEYANALLIVPLPSIIWLTEDDCLPNIYMPIDDDGDIIESYENYDICVEDMQYRGQVEATCIEEYVWYPLIQPDIIGLNINSESEEWDDKLSLATYVNLEPTAYTGEYSYNQEYIVSTGESAECDFTSFSGQRFDAEAYIGEEGVSDILQSFPIPLSADAESGELAYTTELW